MFGHQTPKRLVELCVIDYPEEPQITFRHGLKTLPPGSLREPRGEDI
jgi:hypothetical protein